MNDLQVVWVDYASDLYHRVVDLRYRVLRKPLGMQFSKEQLEAESENLHLAILAGNSVVGCLMLRPLTSDNIIQMKQVAVDPEWQSKGIGQLLLKYAEEKASDAGASKLFCHARDTAVNFYKKNNYKIIGDVFVEVGIPHFYMEKTL